MHTISLLLLFNLIFVLTIARVQSKPLVHRFRHGKLPVTIISDGAAAFSNNPFTAVDDAVRRSYSFNSQPSFPFVFDRNFVIIDTPSGRIMIDAGSHDVPEFPTFEGSLIKNMIAADIQPESIDIILLTHSHFDHVGTLSNRQGKKLFPNAKVFINRKEHEFSINPNSSAERSTQFATNTIAFGFKIYRERIKPYANDLQLVEDFEYPLPGIRFVPAPGHTDYHNVIEITSRGKRLYVVGDVWASRSGNVQNPDWSIAFDLNQTKAYQSRVNIMEMTAKNRDLVISYHEQFPGLGYVVRKGAFFDWIPVMGWKKFGWKY